MSREIEEHIVIFKEANPYTQTGSVSMTMKALFELYAKDMGYSKSPALRMDEKAVIQFLLDYNISCGNCDNSTGECKECQIDYCNQLGVAICQRFSSSMSVTVEEIENLLQENSNKSEVTKMDGSKLGFLSLISEYYFNRVATAIHALLRKGK